MIDAGIGPGRVRAHLAEDGLRLLQIDDILYTHLDRDHAALTWARAKGCRARRWIHRRHRSRAEREGHALARTEVFDSGFEIGEHLRVEPVSCAHDQLGVVVFRITITTPRGVATLGFATDVGRVDTTWTRHLHGVDMLAIESNYCPQLQVDSDRPAFLKQRIMGGSGHLSNEESASAVRAIAPREHVVLLHLSRQCNEPARAATPHHEAPYALTLSQQDEPSPWLWATANPRPIASPVASTQSMLFGAPTREPLDA
jgi:phosphoribosyl 1,2-cyclic phosphodiesterase